jgi:cation transport ATPase
MTEVNSHHPKADHAQQAAEHGHAGHGGHGDHVAQFRRLFWTMLVLAVPTVALSGMFAMNLGYTVPEFPGSQWVSPVLGTVMYLWGGRPFLTGAVSEIRSRTLGMMLLIVIRLLGHWIEMRSLAQTTSGLDSLAALLPDEAERVTGDGVESVAPSELRVDDVVIVRPGGSVPADGVSEDEVLAVAAAAESDSEHPLARAIVNAARRRDLRVPASSDFASSPAVGVTARVDGKTVRVGGPRLLEEAGHAELPETGRWRDEGAIVLHVLVDGAVVGALALADEVREESRQAVDALHKLGIQVVMITGDAQTVAESVAAQLGIDRVFAGVRPEDKAAKVAQLQDEGLKVAMVGDGVNDAPALAQADVGIAIGAGTDVAIASAGVILASSDPRSVLSVIQLSKASYRKMKQNLWWAAGYNLIAVPLAAGVLAPIGFVMPMSVGAILMSISTVVVALNAQLLRRLDLRPEASVQAIL